MPTPVSSTHSITSPVQIAPLVIAPTYNHIDKLPEVLAGVGLMGLPILVVNDGSTDGTACWLSQWTGGAVVTHSSNRGKAAALQSAFQWALAHGYTHAASIDTDGQHDPANLVDLLKFAQANPEALILGNRDRHAANYPLGSRVGRWASNVLVRWESGLRIGDSQCGQRVYPLRQICALQTRAGHYGWETEVLTRWGWAGGAVIEAPVACRYFAPGHHVSHFKPWRDSLRAARMHVRLASTGVARWLRRAPKRILRWMNPLSAWRELRTQGGADSTHAARMLAAALACGVFIACLPAYGFQSILSLLAAKRFKLHPLFVLAGSHLSTWPIGPGLVFCSIVIGHNIVGGPIPADYSWRALRASAASPAVFRGVLIDWIIGGLVLGAVLAGLTYLLSRAAFAPRRSASLEPAQL